MAFRFTSWLTRPLALRSLVRQIGLAVRLFREPRVPTALKAIPIVAAMYVISPVDIVPDFILGLGQLDDIGVVLMAFEFFVRLCPTGAQSFHREAIAQRRPYAPMSTPDDDAIDAEYRRL